MSLEGVTNSSKSMISCECTLTDHTIMSEKIDHLIIRANDTINYLVQRLIFTRLSFTTNMRLSVL